MSYDDAMVALSSDALRFVKDKSVVGLGSGRAATLLVQSLSKLVKSRDYRIIGVPTSLQIKITAERVGIPVVEADLVDHIDVVFDGADQIDSAKHVIKGGGGALLRENILFSLAKKVIVVADRTKFVKNLTRAVPVEIHPQARNAVRRMIEKMGGSPEMRLLDRGYPFFTENGNIILDCDFGTIKNPRVLSRKIKQIPGVIESGLFLKRPDIIYKANPKGKFDVIK